MTQYEVQIRGAVDLRWADWFDGMTLEHNATGTETRLSGVVVDQAALLGLLNVIHNHNLEFVSVLTQCVQPTPIERSDGHKDSTQEGVSK